MKNQQFSTHEGHEPVQNHGSDPFGFIPQRLPGPETGTRIPGLPADLKSWQVLLVEDNQMVRELIKLQLEQLGYQVICAKDGKEALEWFRKRHDQICLVLSDVIMPEMDGWATLAAIRGIRGDTPVILASGIYDSKVKAPKSRHQPQAFIQKPFTKMALKETLEKVLGASTPP